MSDTGQTQTPPDVPVKPARKSLLERLSIVWVIPVVALVVALAVAWQSYVDRGPVIDIVFDNASGVAANKTELRYRDVAVGLVEQVTFTSALDQVLVRVRLQKDVAEFVDSDSKFWVVRPEVSAEGVTGLDTVLTGVFIEGIWDTEPGGFVERHAGLSEAPLSRDGRGGLSLRLRAAGDAGLTENAPIVYRGIEVGRVGRAEVTNDGSTVEAVALIYAPHDRLISSATRFWDTSGFTFKLGPNGAEIDFSSLASLLSGGISFNTVVSGGEPVEDGAIFTVFPDEGAARSSVFAEEAGALLSLTAIFKENVSGLAVDAPVDLGGLRVGRVTGLNGIVDEERFGDSSVRLAATIGVQPGRLGLEGDVSAAQALAFLDRRVQEGLRARLTSASLLTGGLKVEFIEVPNAPEAEIDTDADPYPIVPTTESDIADVAATAEGVFQRINALPIEELMNSAVGMLDNISRLTGSAEAQAVPGEVRALLSEARGVVGNEELQALPGQVAGVVGEVETLVARLNEEEAATRVLTAVDAAAQAGTAVAVAIEGLPDLIARLDAVAAKAEGLPLEELAAEVTALADSAGRLIGSDATQALPAALNDSLTELGAILTDLRETGVAANASGALAQVQQTAADLSGSLEGLPQLVARIDAVAAKAETLPLDRIGTDLSQLLASADAIVSSEGMQALPAALSAALEDLRAVLQETNDANLATNASEALAAAREAATALSQSIEGVPQLVARIDAVAAKAETLPLNRVADEVSSLLRSADVILGSASTQALPGNVSNTLEELRGLLVELRESGAAGTATEALAAARQAAGDLSASLAGVPALVDRIDAVAAKAETVPLNELANDLSALLDSADAVIGTEAAQALPGDLSAALAELRGAIRDLREGGLIENANATLASARQAADSFASASGGLPALLQRGREILDQAGETIRGYEANSGVGRELNIALREVERAASAITSLAKSLERNPNSLLFGR